MVGRGYVNAKSYYIITNKKKTGTLKWYNEFDKLIGSEPYTNGKKNGVANYWTDDGILFARLHYQDDIQSGETRTWYHNGAELSYVTYINGKRDGKYIQRFLNGDIMFQINYRNGKLNGEWKGWLENKWLNIWDYHINGITICKCNVYIKYTMLCLKYNLYYKQMKRKYGLLANYIINDLIELILIYI